MDLSGRRIYRALDWLIVLKLLRLIEEESWGDKPDLSYKKVPATVHAGPQLASSPAALPADVLSLLATTPDTEGRSNSYYSMSEIWRVRRERKAEVKIERL